MTETSRVREIRINPIIPTESVLVATAKNMRPNKAEQHSRGCDPSYHWHLEICPRTSIPSGFELGSGLFVNTISPEEAALKPRSVDLDKHPASGGAQYPPKP